MFKKVIITLLMSVAVVLSTQQASALGLKYGVGAGANISTVQSFGEKINLGSSWGFQVGAHMGLDLGIVAIMPEIWYTKGSASYDAQQIGGDFGQMTIESLDVPVLAVISILGPLKIKAGPSFALWNRLTLPGDEEFNNVKSTYGYVAGVGIEFKSVGLDFRYNGQFSAVTVPTEVNNIYNDIRADSFSVVMYYSF